MKHFISLIITTMLVGIIHAQTVTHNKKVRKYNISETMPVKANIPTGFYDTPLNENLGAELQSLTGTTNKLNSDNTFGFATQFVGSLLGESITTDNNGNLYAIRPVQLETEFDNLEVESIPNNIINKCEQINETQLTAMENSNLNPTGHFGPVLPYSVNVEENSTGYKLYILPSINFKNASIKLYHTTGKIIVQKNNINGANFSTHIPEFVQGIYWLEISESDHVCIQKVWVR